MPLSPIDTVSHERLDVVLRCLEEDWHSYDTLSELTGKPERTLRRDLERLVALGHRLEHKRAGRTKFFRLVPGSRKKVIEPGILEVLAANLGRGLLGFLNGTELRVEMEGLYQQLLTNTRANERQLRDLNRKFWFMADAPRNYAGVDDQLNQLITCILDQRVVQLVYRSREQVARELELHPYTLIVRRECLYVLGVEAGADGKVLSTPRLFDVTRVEHCRRLKRTFELPEDWEPSKCFKSSFGVFIPREGEEPPQKVSIRFRPSVARAIRARRWHESERWREDRLGPILEMDVRLCPELIHWLISFGPTAEVLEPPALRSALIRELRATLDVYSVHTPNPEDSL